MQLCIVNNKKDRDEYQKVLNAHADFVNCDISKQEWEKYPRKVWLDVVENYNANDGKTTFLVIDNRVGDCYLESFDTLDGAILYASDVYTTCEGQTEWDYMGSVKDGGELIDRGECDTPKRLFEVHWQEILRCKVLVEAKSELDAEEMVYDHGMRESPEVKRELLDYGDWHAERVKKKE